MTDAHRDLGSLIKYLRKRKGLTQIELADDIGMSQRWLSDVERGETKLPRIETLHLLANALDYDVAELFIAANIAKTTSGADKIADEFPADGDPLLDVVMLGAKRLNAEGRRVILRIMEDIEKEYSAEK